MNYYLEKLEQVKQDSLQYKAYKSNNNTVVIAGPGSGKTTVLTLKIMRLLNQSINKPRGLACLTYNNEAVREFKDKLDLMGHKKRQNVFLGTVHSFCIAEILNVFGQLYNYNITYPIKIISDNEKKKLFETIKKEQGYEQKLFKKDDMDRIRNLKIRGKSKVIVTINKDILKVANEYEERLERMGMMDYESIINYSTRMIQEHEYVRKCLSAKFPWILIDEYQDLGKPLHEMVLSLFEYTDIKIFAVGDPDQSIYSFSGATPNYLLELRNKDNIEVIEFKNNYRSNQDIIDGSETVLNIKRNYNAATRKDEKAKFYFITCEEDMNQQYEYCVTRIIPFYQKQNLELEEIAILVGNKYEAQEMAMYCLQNNIPYYISKHNFERTDTVKWIEKIASWINDKTKESFEEIAEFYERLLLSQSERNFFSETEVLEKRKKLYNVLIESIKKKNNLKEWIESNEDMYKDIVNNPNKYDVIVPSDYMIDRLIKENRLEKINKSNITNLSNVSNEYLNPEYDKENDYVVPYMTGTLGILYNKKIVKEEVDSWNILWSEKYKGQIWMWDSLRDVIGVVLKRSGFSMNSTSDSELNQAKQSLIVQNKLLKGYAEEESRDAMIADEGALALVYSGEAKFAIDQNPNLDYVIPKEGSNKFVDGFVIVKNTKHKDAAEKIINFMCRSNIAIRNMTSTGYTSPIKGAWDEFGNNKIMFPSKEELSRCEAFLYDANSTEKYNKMWKEVR